MKLVTCMATKNRCYKKAQKMVPAGIVVHSTASSNKYLKRWVQPSKDDPNYDALMAALGKNAYGNDKNNPVTSVVAHAYLGLEQNGTVATYQDLPWDICCWNCGSGKKGSYNYSPAYIQFEILEDKGTYSKAYFEKVYKEAIEFCAYLCKEFGFSIDRIVSHAEAHKQGYASNHADAGHWLKKFGKDMEWFRAEVQKLLADKREEPKDEPKDEPIYLTTPAELSQKEKVKAFQTAAKKDGVHKKCGYTDKNFASDGIWGPKTEKVAAKAEVELGGKFKNCNILAQEYLGRCGFDVRKISGVLSEADRQTIIQYKTFIGFGKPRDVIGKKTWMKLLGVK